MARLLSRVLSSPRFLVPISFSSVQTDLLNMKELKDVQRTVLGTVVDTIWHRQQAIVLALDPKSGLEEVKVDTYFAKDELLQLGEKERETYVIHRFRPLNPNVPATMVTYCITKEAHFVLFLWKNQVASPEPVVISPAYGRSTTPEGHDKPINNVLVSERRIAH